MRMTKKITSIVLAVMMVVSMMSVMAVTANADVGDYVAEEDYLTFTAETAGSTVTLKVNSGGSNLQYDLNGAGLTAYTAGTTITLANVGDYVRFRGKDTRFGYSNHVAITGKVACSGNVMSLLLDDNGKSQGLSNYCFESMFEECTGLTSAPELPETDLKDGCYGYMFYGCTNLTTAPELPATMLAERCYSAMFSGCGNLTTAPQLPATTLARYCYTNMFSGCGRLTTAPELPATSLAPYCYGAMFVGCESLTTAPELPATDLEQGCYSRMFYGCSSIKLSETQTAEYGIPYSVPSGGNGTTASYALDNMFAGTGGTFTGTPEIDKTYYRPAKKYTVTWKNEDGTTLKTDTNVAEGTTPTYDGTTPEKAEDETNTYTFAAWDNGTTTYVLGVDDLPPVTGDVTYTAVFTANPKHTVHTYTANPTFNWTQDASTGDWDCNTLTLTCTGCDLTQDYEVYAFSFGGGGKSSAVTCTANADGSYTYSVSKTVDGTKYEDSKTYNANGVVKSATQLKAAAKKGGSWELGNDIDQAVGISCADGFVLDGNNYTVTRHSNSATSAVFVAANKNASFTLNDLTIDGIANQTEVRPAIASAQSNPNSGNVINLNNVKIINWDFDQYNNGAVLAWGQATVNMKNCTVDTDSTYDVWGGAASTINVDGGELGTVYLNGGTATAELTNGAVVENFATSADNKIKDNGDGTYSVVPRVYVAQVGSTKYETLEESIAAAQDGGTVKLLADQTIDLQLAAGEEYTIDLNSYTLTVESPQNYYNYIYGDLTIDDSSAAKTGQVVVDDYGIAPRAGGKVTVNSGSFTTADGYPYLIYLMGGELEVNGGTFTAVHPVNCYASGKTVLGGTVVINDGEFTSTEDYVISGFENSNITINGGSFTGPNPVFVGKASKKTSGFTPASATINGGTFTATNDTPVVGCAKGASVDIKGGTFTDGELSADSTSEISVSGGTFDSAVPEEYCANGYAPKDNGNGTYGVGPDNSSPLNPIEKAAADINDGNLFGINCNYLHGTLLGVQKKFTDKIDETTSSQEGAKNMRFIAVLDTDLVQVADDYGFVLAKANNTNKTYAEINYDAIKAGDDRVKTISAKGTYNNVCGTGDYSAYGDPTNTTTDYKYITCAVNNVTNDDKVIARFYYKKDGKTYYAKYAGHNYQYTGCMAAWSDLA